MANTYSLISRITVGSTPSPGLTFINIPQTYTDLLIRFSVKGDGTSTPTAKLSINGSTLLVTGKGIEAYGSAGSGTTAASISNGAYVVYNSTSQTSNTFTSTDVYISSYANQLFKAIASESAMENNNTGQSDWRGLFGLMYASTNPVTSVGLLTNAGVEFTQYSSASLYGIKAEI
jgi:hypothetical protein